MAVGDLLFFWLKIIFPFVGEFHRIKEVFEFWDIHCNYDVQSTLVITTLFVTKDFAVKIEFAVNIKKLDVDPSKA